MGETKTKSATKKSVTTTTEKPVKRVKKANLLDSANQDRSIKGSVLIRKIWQKMLDLNIKPSVLATEHLGMAYSYLMALGRGTAPVNKLKIEQYTLMANFLDLPLVQVMLLAEAIQPEHFYYNATVEERIDHVYENMLNDPIFMGFAPSQQDWESLSPSLKLSFCVMYENCAQTKLLNPAELVRVVEKD
jgi:hypothetical protein